MPNGSGRSPRAAEVANGILLHRRVQSRADDAGGDGARHVWAPGPLSPFRARVSADTTWVLSTSAETRIPDGRSVLGRHRGERRVRGRRRPGRRRAELGPRAAGRNGRRRWMSLTAATPQPTLGGAVPGLGGDARRRPGRCPDHLALTNLTGAPRDLRRRRGGGLGVEGHRLGRPRALGVLLARIRRPRRAPGSTRCSCRTSGRAAVSEDVGPTGSYGVVTMPGHAAVAAGGGMTRQRLCRCRRRQMSRPPRSTAARQSRANRAGPAMRMSALDSRRRSRARCRARPWPDPTGRAACRVVVVRRPASLTADGQRRVVGLAPEDRELALELLDL